MKKEEYKLQMALDRFDLHDYVNQTFDQVEIAAGGDELRVNCFAPRGCRGTDTGQHLYINPEKKTWYCFKCGYGNKKEQVGSSWIPRFIADAEKIPMDSVIDRLLCQTKVTPTEELQELLEAAFERVANKDEVKIPELGKITLPKEFYRLCEIARPATAYINYAKERGLSDEDIIKYDVRYCFSSNLWLWKSRIIFPIYDTNGDCRSAVARLIKGKGTSWVNWPKSDINTLIWPVGIFNKTRNRSLIKFSKIVVLTEGVFDALAVNKFTDYQAVCTFGKKLSNGQINLLRNLGVKHIILAWDLDAKKQIKRIVDVLRGRFKISVFPFQSPIWKTNDFGDVLSSKDTIKINALKSELDKSIDTQSTQFLSWVFS